MFAEITFTLADLQRSVGDGVLRRTELAAPKAMSIPSFPTFLGEGGGGINL